MTREEQILRDARGIGLTFLGEPPREITKLWNEGFLKRDNEAPYTYTTVDGAVAEEEEGEDV